MNGLELLRLSRRLTKIAEEAIPRVGLHQLPTSVRSVLVDVFEHPGTSIGEITERTGFPQSLVSASVTTLREGGAVVTAADPDDRRRTVVRPAPAALERAASMVSAPIDGPLAAALGRNDPGEIGELAAALELLASRLTPVRPGRPGDFDAVYANARPAWDIGRPQPAFQALADADALRGRVLDAGCGTGEHALMAAALGLPATGIDTAKLAIAAAEAKARDRGLPARFLVHDALDLPALCQQFDTVLDSGLFHVFGDEGRARYVAGLRAVIPPGGTLHLLCFSDRQPGGFGPRRVTEREVRESFADGWRIDALEEARMELTVRPEGALAWRAAITRVG